MTVTADAFLVAATNIIGRSVQGKSLSHESRERHFWALFGVGPCACSDLWRLCEFSQETKPKHLLWALLFLKTYATEAVLCTLAGTTRKTLRKWIWRIIFSMDNKKGSVVSVQEKEPKMLIVVFTLCDAHTVTKPPPSKFFLRSFGKTDIDLTKERRAR